MVALPLEVVHGLVQLCGTAARAVLAGAGLHPGHRAGKAYRPASATYTHITARMTTDDDDDDGDDIDDDGRRGWTTTMTTDDDDGDDENEHVDDADGDVDDDHDDGR